MATTTQRRIQKVRQFNRFHTRWLGVFGRNFFESTYSMTEGRILFEIAAREPCYAKDLSRDLKLDPGHLSRVLSRLQERALVVRGPCPMDRRRRRLVLTDRGVRALDHINASADKRTANVLMDLDRRDQDRLVEAMQAIRDLLQDPTNEFEPARLREFRSGDLGWVVQVYGLEYSRTYGWDQSFEAYVARIAGARSGHPREHAWFVEQGNEPAGCVFLRESEDDERLANLHLLYVDPALRGQGWGRRLLGEALAFARQAGYEKVRTRAGVEFSAVRSLYSSAGFQLVESKETEDFGRSWVSEMWEHRLST